VPEHRVVVIYFTYACIIVVCVVVCSTHFYAHESLLLAQNSYTNNTREGGKSLHVLSIMNYFNSTALHVEFHLWGKKSFWSTPPVVNLASHLTVTMQDSQNWTWTRTKSCHNNAHRAQKLDIFYPVAAHSRGKNEISLCMTSTELNASLKIHENSMQNTKDRSNSIFSSGCKNLLIDGNPQCW